MDVMGVPKASVQSTAMDGRAKPEAKGKREMDLAEVWAAIFAQAGAMMDHAAWHASASAEAGARDVQVASAETPAPSAGAMSLIRSPGGGVAERGLSPELSPGWTTDRLSSAAATASDGSGQTEGALARAPQAAHALREPSAGPRDEAAWANSVRTAPFADKAGDRVTAQPALQEGQPVVIAARSVQGVARASVNHVEAPSVGGAGSSGESDTSVLVAPGADARAEPERAIHRKTERNSSSSSDGRAPDRAATDLRASAEMPTAGPVAQPASHGAERPDTPTPTSSTLGWLGEDLRAWLTSTGGAGPKTLTVALEPKELGAVKVIVHHGEEGLQIQLVASSAASAHALAAQLPTLVQQMAQGGLTVRDVSVGWATDGGDAGGGTAQRDRGDGPVGKAAIAGPVSSSRMGRAAYGAEGDDPISLINLYA